MLHPDLNHPYPKVPHWDYNDIFGNKWAVKYKLGKTIFEIWEKDQMIIQFMI